MRLVLLCVFSKPQFGDQTEIHTDQHRLFAHPACGIIRLENETNPQVAGARRIKIKTVLKRSAIYECAKNRRARLFVNMKGNFTM